MSAESLHLSKPSKFYIREYIKEYLARHGQEDVRCLDLGCGIPKYFLPVVQEFPNFQYVGVDPSAQSISKSHDLFGRFPNAKFIQALGYDELLSEFGDSFHVVISFSVLEHVKHPEPFLRLSAAAARRGGEIIHLYDLGHALYPTSFKEKLQVWLCSHPSTRSFIPESKIASYVDLNYVSDILNNAGVNISRITFHNMRSHVSFLKNIQTVSDALLKEIAEREVAWADVMPYGRAKELIFPSIALWGEKR